MNILITLRRYPPFTGGAENQLAKLATMLGKAGHNVIVATGRHDTNTPRVWSENNVTVFRLFDPPVRFAGTLIFLWNLIILMIRRRKSFDLVLTSQISEVSSISIIMAKLLGKKSVFRPSSHGTEGSFTWARKHFFGFIYQWTAQKADGMVAQTPLFIPDAVKNGIPETKIKVIPNLCFFEENNGLKIGKDFSHPVNILWCGRLDYEKNPFIVCDIAKLLSNHGVSFQIHMIGDGEEKTNLQKKIKDMELDNLILLEGFQKDVNPFYEKADIYLLTSFNDSMPNTVLEAMAAGVPVVSTNVGGVPYMIQDHKTGLLAESADAEGLAKAIETYIDSPGFAREMAENARMHAQKNFSPEVVLKKYEDLFSTLLETGKTGL